MKIGLISDLHLEFNEKDRFLFIYLLNEADCDVIVDCGDLHPDALQREAFIKQINKKYIFIPGNHDYYGNKFENVFFTDENIVCSTLWTNFRNNPIAEVACIRAISDFRTIYQEDGFSKNITPRFLTEAFAINDKYIFDSECEIVATHFPPATDCTHPRFRDDLYNAYFINDLGDKIRNSNKKLWLCGHSHNACDIMVGDCRIVMNPYGYKSELYQRAEDYKVKILEI